MKKNILLFLAISFFAVFSLAQAKKNATPPPPPWLAAKIKSMAAQTAHNRVSITQWTYKKLTVYHVSAPCCDTPRELLTTDGKHFCYLGGGFTNKVDAKCLDFAKRAVFVRTVWANDPPAGPASATPLPAKKKKK